MPKTARPAGTLAARVVCSRTRVSLTVAAVTSRFREIVSKKGDRRAARRGGWTSPEGDLRTSFCVVPDWGADGASAPDAVCRGRGSRGGTSPPVRPRNARLGCGGTPGESGDLPADVAELAAPAGRPSRTVGVLAVELAEAAPAAGLETEASSRRGRLDALTYGREMRRRGELGRRPTTRADGEGMLVTIRRGKRTGVVVALAEDGGAAVPGGRTPPPASSPGPSPGGRGPLDAYVEARPGSRSPRQPVALPMIKRGFRGRGLPPPRPDMGRGPAPSVARRSQREFARGGGGQCGAPLATSLGYAGPPGPATVVSERST